LQVSSLKLRLCLAENLISPESSLAVHISISSAALTLNEWSIIGAAVKTFSNIQQKH